MCVAAPPMAALAHAEDRALLPRTHVHRGPPCPHPTPMTRPNHGRPHGPRRRPVLRHFLEDDFDRELDRLHGSGRARRRDRTRRTRQYEHRARRLLEAWLDREVDDPAAAGLRLLDLALHPGGALLTVHVGVPPGEDGADRPLAGPVVGRLEALLRAELCLHLPRRHTPAVRIVAVPEGGGER